MNQLLPYLSIYLAFVLLAWKYGKCHFKDNERLDAGVRQIFFCQLFKHNTELGEHGRGWSLGGGTYRMECV